jgi:hypothetical protein
MEQHEKNRQVSAGCANQMGGRKADSQERMRIREHMEVISSCGCHIGEVDRVEGDIIKLTKNDPQASGHHHFISMDWVAKVDDKVYLNKDAEETRRDWAEEPVGANPL